MPALGLTLGVAVHGQVTATGGQVRKVFNVFVYRCPNPGGAGLLNNFIATFDTAVWAVVAPRLHADYTGVEYVGYLPAFMDVGLGTSFPNTQNGAVAGGRLPVDAAVNVGLLTGLRGKTFQGMKRFGPIGTADVVSDRLTPAAVAAWGPALAAMTATIMDPFARLFIPVVLSRQLSTPPPPTFIAIGADILSARLNRTIGLARHRRERTQR
jgi:hypothetical protein